MTKKYIVITMLIICFSSYVGYLFWKEKKVTQDLKVIIEKGGSAKKEKYLFFWEKVVQVQVGQNTQSKHLQYFTDLKELSTFATGIEDLTFLKNHTSIEKLWIHQSKANSLEPLRDLKKLKLLHAHATKVKDLEPIFDLNLEELIIDDWYIPEEQIKEFKKLNPQCKVEVLSLSDAFRQRN